MYSLRMKIPTINFKWAPSNKMVDDLESRKHPACVGIDEDSSQSRDNKRLARIREFRFQTAWGRREPFLLHEGHHRSTTFCRNNGATQSGNLLQA